MFFAAAVFGMLAGLDNFQVGSAIGALPLRRAQLLQLAAAFSGFEILSAASGVVLGHAAVAWISPVAAAAPVLMILCGGAVLLRGVQGEGQPPAGTLLTLPPLLSLDNLTAGVGFGVSGGPLAAGLVIGAMGGVMSCLGLFAGVKLRRFLPQRLATLPGAWLCLLAVRLWVTK